MTDTTEDPRIRIVELARKIPIAMLTTIDGEGHVVSRPMAPQEITDEGVIWFIAEAGSRDAGEIGLNPSVGVSLTSGSSFVSFSGAAELLTDSAKLHELWNPAVEAWLPDGPDSEQAVLFKVTAESGEYWDSPGGRIATVISFVKAKLTGERYDGGENETVSLP